MSKKKSNIFAYNIPDDIQAQKSKIDDILDASKQMQEELDFKEELHERAIQNTILDFIRKNDRILYGGFAMHLLVIKHSHGKQKIYDKGLQDVEAYSPTPFEDLVSLANLLSAKNYPNIQVKEAAHPMTYSIYVNYQQFADFSFMPKSVF